MNPFTSLVNNAVETAASVALKIPGASTTTYAALQTATAQFPGLLKLSSLFYSKVLNGNSKTQLKELIEKDELLGPYYKKFIIITLIMEAETDDPVAFIKQNQDLAKHFLSFVGVTIDDKFDIETLKTRVNEKIGNIIQFIEGQKDKLYELLKKIPTVGGRTKRIKKRRTRRRKGGEDPNQNNMLGKILAPAAYESINRANFNYWYRKDTKKYPYYNSKFYYPSAINGYNPFNSRSSAEIKPELWTERVRRHCNIHRANPSAFATCLAKKCAPGDGEYIDKSSCNLNTYNFDTDPISIRT